MNAEQARILVEQFAGLMENEVPTTCKVLAAVKTGNRDYKPDPKSRSAFELCVGNHRITSLSQSRRLVHQLLVVNAVRLIGGGAEPAVAVGLDVIVERSEYDQIVVRHRWLPLGQ